MLEDSERLWATPQDSGRLRTTPNDSDYERLRLRTTPTPKRLRATPDDFGRLRLRASPDISRQFQTASDERIRIMLCGSTFRNRFQNYLTADFWRLNPSLVSSPLKDQDVNPNLEKHHTVLIKSFKFAKKTYIQMALFLNIPNSTF